MLNKFFINRLNNLDLSFAYIILTFGIIFSLFQIYRESSPAFPLFFIVFSVIYIISRNKINNVTLNFEHIKFYSLLNDIIFVLLFICMIFSIFSFINPFPITFYLILSLMVVSIALSIFLEENNLKTLLKIIILNSLIRASIFFAFSTPYGIDPNFHLNFVNTLVETGQIPHTGYFDGYYYYPIYHLLLAVLNYLTLIPLKSLLFVVGIIQISIVTLIIYLTGNKIANKEIGLLASLIFCTASPVIMEYLIPNMFALAPFAVLFYILIFKNNIASKIIFLILLISLTVTHAYPVIILAFVMVVSLFILVFLDIFKIGHIKKNILNITNTAILLSLALFLGHSLVWGQNPFLRDVIINTFVKENTIDVVSTIATFSFSSFYNDLSSLIIGFAILGSLFWIKNRKEHVKLYFSLLTLVLIGIYLGIHALGLSFIPLPYRMLPFIYIPVSILAAQGIFYIYEILVRTSSSINFSKVMSIIIITVIFGFSITSVEVNPDMGLYGGEISFTPALTTSELAGLAFTLNFPSSNASYDFFEEYYIEFSGTFKNYPRSDYQDADLLVLRSYYLENAQLREKTGDVALKNIAGNIPLPTYENIKKLNNWDILYENGNTLIYKKF